jgi:hypothetical protein
MKVFELMDRAVLESSIAKKRCFACGGSPSGGTGEHIIPLWLQNKLLLFDERLTLLNRTRVPYRNLTVPCCENCNTGFLSKIENSVQSVFHQGGASSSEETLALARWLSKILIGVLVKETSLLFDRSKPSLGAIVEPSLIDELRHCQLYNAKRQKDHVLPLSPQWISFLAVFLQSVELPRGSWVRSLDKYHRAVDFN